MASDEASKGDPVKRSSPRSVSQTPLPLPPNSEHRRYGVTLVDFGVNLSHRPHGVLELARDTEAGRSGVVERLVDDAFEFECVRHRVKLEPV